MQKQLRIITSRRLAVCPFSLSFGPVPPLPAWVFGKHLGRRAFFNWCPSPGIKVYNLPCGCCLWVHSTGQRFLSALPF